MIKDIMQVIQLIRHRKENPICTLEHKKSLVQQPSLFLYYDIHQVNC